MGTHACRKGAGTHRVLTGAVRGRVLTGYSQVPVLGEAVTAIGTFCIQELIMCAARARGTAAYSTEGLYIAQCA